MAQDAENNPRRISKFTRCLTIITFLIIIIMDCWSFFTRGCFSVSNGVVLLTLFAIILALAESFDELGVGSVLRLKRDLRSAREDVSSAKKEASELREQLLKIIAINVKNTQQQLTTVNVNSMDTTSSPLTSSDPNIDLTDAPLRESDPQPDSSPDTCGKEGSDE